MVPDKKWLLFCLKWIFEDPLLCKFDMSSMKVSGTSTQIQVIRIFHMNNNLEDSYLGCSEMCHLRMQASVDSFSVLSSLL